ncbi:5-oxoprolinase subunit C family protein [Robertmurraya massiliosenegalensis]|uniref:5-oxoprolinase subunit C family protein n=1 Tax=Robertmurraya massiliosenegalensis TaxID=1287657 RepID=UPI00031CA27A|nr:biotin-dependent carboxyltransferase family protein [Robertmurraya massiliosenegalensis]
MESITIEKSGMLTTIQDLGREEYQSYGISIGGAMDKWAFRIGNILVGNDENTAAIEFAFIGPKLRFHGEGYLAISGANCSPKLNGKTISMWKVMPVEDGDILSFGSNKDGCYTYVAIAGGIEVKEVLGSKSTSLRAGYGGYEGRTLRQGDRIVCGNDDAIKYLRLKGRKLRPERIPIYQNKNVIRFIWGPHEDFFAKKTKENFTSNPYKISKDSDQMGYRLEGMKLDRIITSDILSYYISPGAIQIPRDGTPILLMPHCGMSGGYTVIGTVIDVDMPFAAQKKPNETIYFEPISVEEAQLEFKKQEKWLRVLKLNNL